MDDLLTQAEIEQEIQRVAAVMEGETLALPEKAKTQARAEVAYKVAFAQAFLRADGAVGLREQIAMAEVADQFMDRKIADAEYDAAVETLRSLRARLDAYRTLAANVRAQT